MASSPSAASPQISQSAWSSNRMRRRSRIAALSSTRRIRTFIGSTRISPSQTVLSMVATARTISEGNEASLSDPPQRLETLQDARTIRLTLGIFQYYSVGGRLGLL